MEAHLGIEQRSELSSAVTHIIAASGEHLDLLQMLDSKPSRQNHHCAVSFAGSQSGSGF